MTTLQDRLDECANRTIGFDYLRLLLAAAILCWHTVITSLGNTAGEQALANPLVKASVTAIVPMFFAISGFLVAASLERSATLVSYLYLRAIRIFPALIVAVLLSALVLGPVLTSYPPGQYFTDGKFWTYLVSATGSIRYQLPGLFLQNPYPDVVNAPLWTIPVEFQCYLALPVIALVTGYRRPWFWAAMLALMLAYAARQAFFAEVWPHLAPGRLLLFFFLCGVGLYRFRASVPFNGWLCAAGAVTAAALLGIPGGMFFAVIPCAYATIYLGLTSPRRTWLVRSGDYSYGLFLCHFPIQQALVASFGWAKSPYLNGAASIVLALLFAMASWHVIEKRALRRKSATKAIDAFVTRQIGRLPPRWFGQAAKAEQAT